MDNFIKWEKMLNSVGTSPKIWRVFEEMKQEIESLNKEKLFWKELAESCECDQD